MSGNSHVHDTTTRFSIFPQPLELLAVAKPLGAKFNQLSSSLRESDKLHSINGAVLGDLFHIIVRVFASY